MKLTRLLFSIKSFFHLFAVCTCLSLFWVSGLVQAAPNDSALIGSQIYRDGIRPSGEPVTALVAGDVPILGTQFSCQSCHGRSGMGSNEASYIIPPITSRFLFSESSQPKRPAYNQESLANVLRTGITPSGRMLDTLMPRFEFSDEEVESLTAYLRELSPGNSAGVNNKVIRFATVVTDRIPNEERSAVFSIIQKFAADINKKTRLNDQRLDRGYTPSSKLPTVFRQWEVKQWLLTGSPESWRKQLETYYQKNPVFALVGGLGHDTWGEINRFCEEHEVPCLLPSTDLPENNEGDFYTLYFSEGLRLEAKLIAHHVQSQNSTHVLQGHCSALGEKAATMLKAKLLESGIKVENISLDCQKPLPAIFRNASIHDENRANVLWLDNSQVGILKGKSTAGALYLSSTLLKRDFKTLPSQDGLFLAHPFRLPGDIDPAMRRFNVWAKIRKIKVDFPRRQAEAFFACLMLNDAIKHIGRFFIRDYVLDMLDHAQGLVAYVPLHPKPTLGPGQRYMSKGGYVVPVKNGMVQNLEAQWIIP